MTDYIDPADLPDGEHLALVRWSDGTEALRFVNRSGCLASTASHAIKWEHCSYARIVALLHRADECPGTVWIVSSGSYSDYRVHCAAPSKRGAREIVAALNGADERPRYFVERLPVIEKAERITVYGFEAVIEDAGTVRNSVLHRDEWNVNPLYPQRLRPVTVRWVRAPIYHGRAGRLEVYGTDRERVGKTFSDMKAQLVADPALRKRREFTR